MKAYELLHEMRTSNCSTSYYRSPVGGDKDCWRAIDNGYIEGGVAINLVEQDYTGARICIVNNKIPLDQDPVIDFRLMVLDVETKGLRAISYNLADELHAVERTTGNGEITPVDFPAEPEDIFVDLSDGITPVSIRPYEGERLILATALFGTYAARNVTIINGVCNKAMMARHPQAGFNRKSQVIPAEGPFGTPSGDFVGWGPGQMLTIGGEPSGNYPDMELVPFPR